MEITELMTDHDEYMREAIALADENTLNGGGPFGTVVVYNGEIVGRGTNRVTAIHDPTAHAEIIAIRDAAQRLKNFDLSSCILYTSCEPCPMCLAAIYWARIPTVYYANTRVDAEQAGFDDDFIYRELALPIAKRYVVMKPLLRVEAISTFENWKTLSNKTKY